MLSSCSTFGFLFDRLPLITTWQMDRMFDLRDEQEKMVENSTEQVADWLVTEGFPSLIARLENALALWKADDYEAAAMSFEAGLETSISEFLIAVRPHLIPLFMTFDKLNAEAYRAYNNERKADWFESLESAENKIDSRVERLEDWFGNLNRSQKQEVSEIVLLLPRERDIRMTNNEQWKERFLEAALLRDEQALYQWLADPSIWWTDAYTDLREENKKQRRALLGALIKSMTDTQSAHVIERVEDWVSTLRGVL